jgi:hypothetical protein
MLTIRLTRAEAKFIRNRMRLTAMNETGEDAATAAQIADAIEPELAGSQLFREIREVFADLYPEGRE